MADNLSRTPDYTCLETIERSGVFQHVHMLDRIRVEVALVSGRELFSWPGAEKFEEVGLYGLVGGGTTATGDFAMHARTVFSSRSPVFEYKGEEVRGGRPALRYSYLVPRLLSNYGIHIGDKSAIAGFRGDFWADRETLGILRLEVHADEVPPDLGISGAVSEIEYGNVRLGDSECLLPQSVVFTLKLQSGEERRNRTVFTGCRQYVGRAVLSFGETPDTNPSTARQITEIQVPAGLTFDARLTTPVDSENSAVGDPITAVVAADVKKDGIRIVPKGATLTGRIRRLEKRVGALTVTARGPQADLYLVGLEFSQLAFSNKRAKFFGEMVGMGSIPGVGSRQSTVAEPDKLTGVGLILVRASQLRLPSGFRMEWRTSAPPKK